MKPTIPLPATLLRLACAAAGFFMSCRASAQTFEIIKTFNGNTAFSDGTEASGNPCFDSDGNMYGCCSSGGTANAASSFGGGTLWKLTPAGTFSVLTRFDKGVGIGGMNPQIGPQIGADGSLFGPNKNMDAINNRGAIYKVTTSGVRTGVLDFPFVNNTAANPYAPTVRGPGGEIYGVTMSGGSAQLGSLWRVDAAGSFSTLVSLTRNPGSAVPGDIPIGVTVGTDGIVRFMARGTNPSTFVSFPILYQWSAGVLTSSTPFPSSEVDELGIAMTTGSDGHLYAITREPVSNLQRFYRVTTAGVVTLLQTLPSAGGGGRNGVLFEAADGNFYTITYMDGVPRAARITPGGGYTVLATPAGGGWVTGLAPGPGSFVYGVLDDDNTADAFLGGAVFRFPITLPSPEIVLEHPTGPDLTDGTASIDYGTVNTGSSSAAQTFTIKNTGTVALKVTGASVTGGNAGDFTVNTTGMTGSVAAAGSTSFTVTFTPTASGARTTTLQIQSDDADEATFDITLTGTGNVPVDADADGLPDAWEITHFGSAGAALGTDDTDLDGLNNFGEYAFGLNPKSGDLASLPQATLSGGLLTLTVTKQPRAAYTIVASTDLTDGSFSGAGLTLVTDDATTLTVRENEAGTRRFMQIRAVPAP